MLTKYFAQDLSALSQRIHDHGIAIIDDFLPIAVIHALRHDIETLAGQALLKAAGTGRGHKAVNPNLRGDHIYWLDEPTASPAQRLYFEQMQMIQQDLNRQLFLNLHSLESHLALYTPGMRYQKHIDRFKDEHPAKPQRQISSILYLNAEWQQENGGHLRIYLPEDNNLKNTNYFDILPVENRAVFFLSDTFYHEVLPANRDRLSLTGWFLTR